MIKTTTMMILIFLQLQVLAMWVKHQHNNNNLQAILKAIHLMTTVDLALISNNSPIQHQDRMKVSTLQPNTMDQDSTLRHQTTIWVSVSINNSNSSSISHLSKTLKVVDGRPPIVNL
jgi:hypothetical protein